MPNMLKNSFFEIKFRYYDYKSINLDLLIFHPIFAQISIFDHSKILSINSKNCSIYCKTRAVGGRRNPSAYVVVGTPLPFDIFFRKNFLVTILPFFTQNCEFQKTFHLPPPPPTNNSQSSNCDDPQRNAPCTLKTLILLKM